MKILVLYSGSRELEKIAQNKWHETFSVDWGEDFPWTDLRIDIEQLKISDIPWVPDMIWVSTDCTTYSIAACSKHRNKDRSPKTEYAKKCDRTNIHWIWLINEWKKLNPNLVYFIENPQGNLKKMYFMQNFPMYLVWYCQYWDERAKPTNIWTNSKTWKPRPVCRNYKYDKEWNIVDKHCHHESARRWARTGTQWRKNSYERSKIPKQLCEEVIDSLEVNAI